MSVNGVSLENVDYGTAVSVLRDSGAAVNLVVKRRIVLGAYPEPITYKVTLTKSKKKDGTYPPLLGPFGRQSILFLICPQQTLASSWALDST